jgi:hypothetical protein
MGIARAIALAKSLCQIYISSALSIPRFSSKSSLLNTKKIVPRQAYARPHLLDFVVPKYAQPQNSPPLRVKNHQRKSNGLQKGGSEQV